MIKRLFFSALIAFCVFQPLALGYDDIPGESPYFYAIEYLRRNDVFQNTKLFKPDTIITRAEFIKYLVLLNSPKFKKPKTIHLPYKDTQDSAWYAPYFYEAIRTGVLNGRENEAKPNLKLNMKDAIILLFNSRTLPIPKRYAGTMPYKDLKNMPLLQGMIMRAIELGFSKPDRPDRFGVYRPVSRAEAAWMIYKMDLVDLRDPDQKKETAVTDPGVQKILSAWQLITQNYVDRDAIDVRKLSDSALKAMAESLGDPYTVYMDQEENQSFSDEIGGQIEGIGAYLEMKENKDIVIVAPIPGSPAAKAGILPGDLIKKVDDFDVAEADLGTVVRHIKGPKGTSVKLTLERNGLAVVIDVVRDVVTISALQTEVTGNGRIMHIKLVNFNQNAVSDFKNAAEIIQNNPEIKGIVLDVRNNPGGLLDAAIGILNYLLPKNSVAVNIQYNYFNYSEYTVGDGALSKYPMAVLINKGSASASEIVAGALQDFGAATVIGETSFGKGTVQEINYFNDNSSLKLTVAKWFTPLMKGISKTGIRPDIEMKNDANASADPQLTRAVEELSKKIR